MNVKVVKSQSWPEVNGRLVAPVAEVLLSGIKATFVEVMHPPRKANTQWQIDVVPGCDQDQDISTQSGELWNSPCGVGLLMGCILAQLLPLVIHPFSLPFHGLIPGTPFPPPIPGDRTTSPWPDPEHLSSLPRLSPAHRPHRGSPRWSQPRGCPRRWQRAHQSDGHRWH